MAGGEAISQSSWTLSRPSGEAEASAAPDKVTDGLRFALETVVRRGDKDEAASGQLCVSVCLRTERASGQNALMRTTPLLSIVFYCCFLQV